MSAPPIPRTTRGTHTKSWAAWEFLWEALSDGEWHRSVDLTSTTASLCAVDISSNAASELLRKAAAAGLIEREERPIRRDGLPGPAYGRGVLWYRRKPEDGAS